VNLLGSFNLLVRNFIARLGKLADDQPGVAF
jgi:hypothetical protein